MFKIRDKPVQRNAYYQINSLENVAIMYRTSWSWLCRSCHVLCVVVLLCRRISFIKKSLYFCIHMYTYVYHILISSYCILETDWRSKALCLQDQRLLNFVFIFILLSFKFVLHCLGCSHSRYVTHRFLKIHMTMTMTHRKTKNGQKGGPRVRLFLKLT